MYDTPTAAELIGAVAGFLREDVSPTLSGRMAFHARVAVNVLEMVRRELTLGPAGAAGATQRLAALLGKAGPLAELEAELCDRIAAGEVGAADPALIDHLWATAMDTLAVDQPGYATYRRASELAARAPSIPSGPSSPSGEGEMRLSPPSGGSTAEGREGGPRPATR